MVQKGAVKSMSVPKASPSSSSSTKKGTPTAAAAGAPQSKSSKKTAIASSPATKKRRVEVHRDEDEEDETMMANKKTTKKSTTAVVTKKAGKGEDETVAIPSKKPLSSAVSSSSKQPQQPLSKARLGKEVAFASTQKVQVMGGRSTTSSSSSSRSRAAAAPAPPSDEEEEDEEEDASDYDEEDDEEDDDVDFEDVSGDDLDDDDDLSDAIADDDDFEVKAEKHRRQILKEGRLAAAEYSEDTSRRNVKPKPLKDMEGGMESDDEDVHDAGAEGDDDAMPRNPADVALGLAQEHSTEELRDRIKEILQVLANFKDEREEGRSRDEYLTVLRADLKQVFEYNDFLLDCVLAMFSPQEAFEFLDAMEKVRPTTIRVNTIKTSRRDLVALLTKRNMNIEPLEKWSKVGLQIFESNVPIAGTVEYLAGFYMLQSAVSFLPVMALAPQENEKVLDMAAAPGGKTTYIAQLMKNTGILMANDVSEPRIKSLTANLLRLGVRNAIVTHYDGVGYEKIFQKFFDRVLLDAPCTGSGIISRDKSIKTSKELADVQRASELQKRLLTSAIDATKVGGYIVYSTCSFLVEEDEAVVDAVLKLRRGDVQLVEMGLPFGRPGFTKHRHQRFDDSMTLSRRYFPHVHNMDGFFVCKLKKVADQRAGVSFNHTPATTSSSSSAAPSSSTSAKKSAQQHSAVTAAVEAAKAMLLKRAAAAAGTTAVAAEAGEEVEARATKTALRLSIPPPTTARQVTDPKKNKNNKDRSSSQQKKRPRSS